MTTAQTDTDSQRWLVGVNFFLADVRDGLGPFLGVFLLGHGWHADAIGYLMTAAGLAGMLATTPMGAWVDASRRKRGLLAGATLALIACNLALWALPVASVAAATQILAAIIGALFAPAIMGLTLGLVGPRGLPRQLGLNEAWNHAGNVAAAALAGLAGYRWGLSAVFVLMVVVPCGAFVCLGRIRPSAIDHDVARGAEPAASAPVGPQQAPGIWQVLSRSKALRRVALIMMLFHLGNAAMLPLLGQSAVARGQADPSAYTALTIIVAQLVMIPVALLAGRHARQYGYWRLLALACCVLPLRGLLAAALPAACALVPVQMMDGVAAGLMGVALPGLVASILRGSGHVNAGLGAVMAIQGVGAALSPALGGWVAQHHGYGAAFIALSVVATLSLALVATHRTAGGGVRTGDASRAADVNSCH
ncbi:MFS transporter [Achromobacter ruhlandii]|uniref:MFS transporter n=1 Tax=Achromobacter ruhlandii TaxID=72557 RepID=UPI003B9975A3